MNEIILIETMKMVNGEIPLLPLHLERLSNGMKLLGIEEKEIDINIKGSARIRLTVPGYAIESEPLQPLKETGLIIDVSTGPRKLCDKYSNLKLANRLPYIMGAAFVQMNNLDDCLILNEHERIADSTIANVFIIKDSSIITPPLSEGCVAGVMRKCLMNTIQSYQIIEQSLTIDDILAADEIFLTNAVRGIRSVKYFRDKVYTDNLTVEINNRFVKTIWNL